VTGVAIYVEGGGDSRDGKAALRQGFDALFDAQKTAARNRRMGWKLVLCGGRDAAFEAFQQATRRDRSELVALLVDAEQEVASATAAGRVAHLTARDRWDLSSMSPDRVHLMTQCMEAWIVADADALAAFYRQDFQPGALPRRTVLDDEPKDSLYAALRTATRHTKKGVYGKINHASELLKRIRPEAVAARCTSFRDFTEWLNAAITGAPPADAGSPRG
jgi:hypothetical protein